MNPRLNQALNGINKQLQHIENLISSRPTVTILVPDNARHRLEIQKYPSQNDQFPPQENLFDGANRRVDMSGGHNRRTFLPIIWGLSKLASSLSGTKASAGFNLGSSRPKKRRPVHSHVGFQSGSPEISSQPVIIQADAQSSSPVMQISPLPVPSAGFQIQGSHPGMQINQVPSRFAIQGSSPGFQIQGSSPGMQVRPVSFAVQGSSPGFQVQGSSPEMQVRPVNFEIQGSSPDFDANPVGAQAELQFQLPSLLPKMSANLDFLALRSLPEENTEKHSNDVATQSSGSTEIGHDNTTRKTLKHHHEHQHNSNVNFNKITGSHNKGGPGNQNGAGPSPLNNYPLIRPVDQNSIPPRPQYSQPLRNQYAQPPMDPYNQPPRDSYNQLSRDSYNNPPPKNPYSMPPRGDGNPGFGGSWNQNVNIGSNDDDSGLGSSRPKPPPKRFRPGQDDGGIIDMGGMPYANNQGRDRNRRPPHQSISNGDGVQNSNTNINLSKRRSADGIRDVMSKEQYDHDDFFGN